jgi:hypothetical protein
MKKGIIILMVIVITITVKGQSLFESSTQTDNTPQTLSLNGYVRGSLFGAGDRYDFTNAFGEVSLLARLKKDKFIMNSDIRFRSGYYFNQSISELEIKEAYAGISSNSVDVLLGEQIISWGRTDGFNPTNNITLNNYFFLSANPDDQKIPNFLLKTDFRITPQIDWEIIAIPLFRPSLYRYDLFDMGSNVSFADALLPEKSFKNASLATKINFELPVIGFSASWFRGYDPFYGFDLKNIDFSTGSPIITYIPSFYQKNTIGLDFSLPLGTWIIRGEGAYTITKNDDHKIFIPNKDLAYVAALEHSFGGFLTILQYIGKSTLNFTVLSQPVLTDPTNMMAQLQYATEKIQYESASFNRKIFHQQEKTDHALSLSVSRDFSYETVNAELSGYYDFTSKEYMFRPKVSWKIGGALSASAGYYYMNGPDKSVFNYASSVINGAFLELKASF